MLPTKHLDLLRCPECRGKLQIREAVIACDDCGFSTSSTMKPPDLRPKRQKEYTVTLKPASQDEVKEILQNADLSSPINICGDPTEFRVFPEYLSLIKTHCVPGGLVIEIGSGNSTHRRHVQEMGNDYFGIDYLSKNCDANADAHQLPLKDNSADLVFASSVFLELSNPMQAAAEVHRILKPGGYFIASFAFGEPFQLSWYHLTPYAVVKLIVIDHGFTLLRMWPAQDTLLAFARTGRYPVVIRYIIRFGYWLYRHCPWLSVRKFCSKPSLETRLDLYNAATICIFAQKPA